MPRPTKLDDNTVQKLEEAFILGATVKEACFNADISKQTYYNWIEADEELLDRFDRLKQAPVLLARKTVVQALKKDPKLAMRYLEKMIPQENQSDDDKITGVVITYVDSKEDIAKT